MSGFLITQAAFHQGSQLMQKRQAQEKWSRPKLGDGQRCDLLISTQIGQERRNVNRSVAIVEISLTDRQHAWFVFMGIQPG